MICCRVSSLIVGMNLCAPVMMAKVIFGSFSHITSLLFSQQGVASQSAAEHPLWVVMKTANAITGFPLGVNEVFSKQNSPT